VAGSQSPHHGGGVAAGGSSSAGDSLDASTARGELASGIGDQAAADAGAFFGELAGCSERWRLTAAQRRMPVPPGSSPSRALQRPRRQCRLAGLRAFCVAPDCSRSASRPGNPRNRDLCRGHRPRLAPGQASKASADSRGPVLLGSRRAGTGTTTYLWNARTRRITAILGYPNAAISPLASSPDGRTLAVGQYDGHIYLWDLADWR
jgi:hypothetical protein